MTCKSRNDYEDMLGLHSKSHTSYDGKDYELVSVDASFWELKNKTIGAKAQNRQYHNSVEKDKSIRFLQLV